MALFLSINNTSIQIGKSLLHNVMLPVSQRNGDHTRAITTFFRQYIFLCVAFQRRPTFQEYPYNRDWLVSRSSLKCLTYDVCLLLVLSLLVPSLTVVIRVLDN